MTLLTMLLQRFSQVFLVGVSFACLLLLSGCYSHYRPSYSSPSTYPFYYPESVYRERLPETFETGGEKTILVDPGQYVWGAYDSNGALVKAGPATAGGEWCDDIQRSCRTSVGTFRINSLGDAECVSRIYPKPDGGGLMPYCMYFNGGEALHGSPDGAVVEDNISHGCVRMRIVDAEWLRYQFATIGTKVIIEPY